MDQDTEEEWEAITMAQDIIMAQVFITIIIWDLDFIEAVLCIIIITLATGDLEEGFDLQSYFLKYSTYMPLRTRLAKSLTAIKHPISILYSVFNHNFQRFRVFPSN